MAAAVGLEQERIIDCLCEVFPQIGRGAITLIAAGCNFNITECCNVLSERENKGCSESTTYMYTICARIVDFIQKGYKVMVLMRGLPGSGKTYLAINLLDRGLGNVNRDEFIFSPHDYFNKSGRYIHNPQELLEVHTWNERRVYANAKMNVSPIIIDSPNLEIREMKIYCTMAVQLGYIIEIVEVATPWALYPKELALRNIHGVNEEDIKLMLERYERNVNLTQLMENFELVYEVPMLKFRDHPPLLQISSRDSVVQLTQVDRRLTEEELLDKRMEAVPDSSSNVRLPSSIGDGAFRVIGSKIEGVPDSKQLAEIILKHSEETTKMRNEIMNFLTTDIKTGVVVISQQLGEMKQIVMDQSEEVKETVLEHLDEMKETVLDQSEEMKEMLPMQNHRNIQLTSSIEAEDKIRSSSRMAASFKAIEHLDVSDNSGQPVQTLTTGFPDGPNDPLILDPNDINIVLVGETGVGKSTFINAFVNYLYFENLEKATACSDIHCLIGTRFAITDENFEERVVTFRGDENESHIVGSSATQSSRSYRFFIDDRYVRLIDTPGIGDTRGIVKDEENFDRLLEALADLKFVHAFCILLKPNNARFTVLFQYCIKQLLSRLDKSASRNIVFVFTNSRSTFYKPGDSLGPIKEILKSIKDSSNVDIPFGKNNVFCMDNESFRFLLARRDGINFSDSEKKDFAGSWEKSVDVSKQMFSYIARLEPHKMQDTISINEARRLIITLSEPLAQVAKNIDDNLRIIARKQSQLDDKNKTIEELKQCLHLDMLRIKVIEISYPKTVCTHKDCTKVQDIEGSKHINYKTVCHERCYLMGVPKQVIGSPELRRCAAMGFSFTNPLCRNCDHSFSLHMHIYFDTEPYISREIDKKVDADIKKEEDVRSSITSMIAELKKKRESLEKEKSTVQKSMAKFAHFLSHNAITPYNDTYQEYIQYLIDNENSYGPSKDERLIASYKDLINVHKEQTNILNQQLKQAEETNSEAIVITAKEVMNLVQGLYELEFSGKVIREFYEKQQHTRQCENLLHTEKNVGGRGLVHSIKKGFSKIMSKSIQWHKNSAQQSK